MTHSPLLGQASPPLVTVIVRSMDRASLPQALASIAAQTWPAIEVVVVNARGGQHTPQPAQCGPFALRLVDAGPLDRSAAANAGLRAAQGSWACFLDDDDWLEPGHIEGIARELQDKPQAVAAYAGVRCVEQVDGEWREVITYHEAFDAGRLLCENYLPIHAVVFSMDAARQCSFDESLRVFEDWDFWIQLAARGPFARVDQVSAVYRLGAEGSGLRGDTALQERTAERILAKWLPHWQQADVAALWRAGRNGWQEQARAAARLRLRDAELRQRDELVAARDATIGQFEAALHESNRTYTQALQEANEALAEANAARAQREQAYAELAQDRDRVAAELEAHRTTAADLARALETTTREYENAVALLRQEQLTVLRPIARRTRQALRPVVARMPRPLKDAARALLRRQGTPVLPPGVVETTPVDASSTHQWREALAGGTPGAATFIVFPVIDWHFRIQRPQHLARELAQRGHRVLYLTTTFAEGEGPAACHLLGSPAPNVHILQLALPGKAPNIYEDTLSPQQAHSLAHTLAWLQREAGLGRLVSIVDLPFWRPVANALPANLLVYDCMDYHAGFSTNTDRMLDEEHALLRDCDVLITTSVRLFELMQAQAPAKPHALVRNGTQVDHFAIRPPALKLQDDGRPVIGYFGAISEWFDMPLLVEVARARPHWRFVLVGSTFGCDVSEAQKLPNIEFMGEVPYAELPGWVHAFDVCTIPFIINELTSCTNPVKVYEYLSAGKPVVATRMPELEVIEDQVLIADDAPAFVAQLERALAEGRSEAQSRERTAWARQHSWRARADLLDEAVTTLLPRVSVVVLCYNNLALTQACLASVEANSHWPDLELIVVDNASADGTADWLRGYAASRPWVKLVLNERNLGFAAGNNVGLEVATGEMLVMLNNDTQVSPGWIQGLWRHLQRDPKLGMVGPVTNNIGNEAKVDVGYADPADMPAWAAARTIRYAGRQTACRVLAFFCVAMRRAVYEKVGGLDEAFGLGFFEDDDYCNRARAAGWQLAIADDVFVHHHLSASFDKLKASKRQELFERNRAIYERKWGPWIPHQYRAPETIE